MRRRARYDVCAAVISHLPYDARVWKEARTLADAGYRVILIGGRYGIQRTQRRTEHGVDVVEIRLGERSAPGRRHKPRFSRRLLVLLTVWFEQLRTPARCYHAHNIHTGPAAWIASRLRHARLVYDAHELYGEVGRDAHMGDRLAALGGLMLERLMVHRSDLVVTTNLSRVRALHERHRVDGIEILGNVPNRVETVTPLDPGYPQGRTILLYQGGVYARARAFRETCEALALLPEVELVVIGFGQERDLDLVREWAVAAGVADRVHLLPSRPFGDLVHTAAAATVGLVPIKPDNMNHYFGDTNKLFEYLMAGLPVVASDLPEIRRVVTAGDPHVGELFEATSPESIAAAVHRVIDDPTTYAARREQARVLALDRFNWQIEASRLRTRYGSLVPLGSDGFR